MIRSLCRAGLPVLLAVSAPTSTVAVDAIETAWSEILTDVVRDGNVDYGALAVDPSALHDVAEALDDVDVDGLPSDAARAAFWLNGYNILIVQAIVDEYPVPSPRAIAGFFDRDRHGIAGRRLTLDMIEQRELLARTRDPRFHFALVCAARSCPPLIESAYTAADLDDQLEARARAVIDDEAFVRVDDARQRIVLSKIFEWYRDDFEQSGTLREYLDRYRRSPLPADWDLEFLEYDWTLNDTELQGLAVDLGRTLRFTPSALLAPGDLEVQLFNNLYTQTAFYDAEGNEQDPGGRSTYFTANLSIKRGLRHRLNGGLDLILRSVRDETFVPEGNPAYESDSRTALTSVTPNIQFGPFASVPTLSIESGLRIPVASDLQGESGKRPFLAFGDPAWINELFYDLRLNRRVLFFFRLGAFFRFSRESAQLTTPLTVILNTYPTRRWTLYAAAEAGPAWLGDARGTYYSQVGLGTKYLIQPWFEVELLYTTFPAGENSGAGETYNLGLRVLH